MKSYEFDIKMKTPDMFAFMLRQSYGGIRGIAFLLVDLALILSLIFNWNDTQLSAKLIMIVLCIVLTVIEPLQLLLKARAQVSLSERFQSSTHYLVNNEGIRVSQGEESMALKWGHLHRYKNSPKRIYVYTSRASAFIFPKGDIGNEASAFLLSELSAHKADFMTLGLDSIVTEGGKENEGDE